MGVYILTKIDEENDVNALYDDYAVRGQFETSPTTIRLLEPGKHRLVPPRPPRADDDLVCPVGEDCSPWWLPVAGRHGDKKSSNADPD